MVSEAKKPLVASMAFLALFSTIILVITCYLIASELKLTGPTTSGTDSVGNKSQNDIKPEDSGKKEGSKPGLDLKGAAKLTMAANKFQVPESYKVKYEIIVKGEYLEPKPQVLLSRFLDYWYYKNAVKEAAEDKEPKIIVDTLATEETPATTTEPSCPLFSLKNTFGLPDSDGYFGYYHAIDQVELKKDFKPDDFKKIRDFVANKKFNVIKDSFMTISKRLCHVVLLLDATVKNYDSGVFSDKNIEALVDKFVSTKTPWDPEALKGLKIPSGFGLFVGLEPEPAPPVASLQDFRELEIVDKTVKKISNVFSEEGSTAFYYGVNLKDLKNENFDCIQSYAQVLKFNDYKHNDNIKMSLSLPEFNKIVPVTIHYSAKTEKFLKELKLKNDHFVDSILDKSLTNRRVPGKNLEFFEFVKKNLFCVLFVFERISDAELERLFACNDNYKKQSETSIFYIYDSKHFIKIRKFENYENHLGVTAFEFIMEGDDDVVGPATTFAKLDYAIKMIKGDGLSEPVRKKIFDELIASFDNEAKLIDKWSDFCTKTKEVKNPIKITIIKNK